MLRTAMFASVRSQSAICYTFVSVFSHLCNWSHYAYIFSGLLKATNKEVTLKLQAGGILALDSSTSDLFSVQGYSDKWTSV